MATQTPKPNRHIYQVTDPDKYKEVRHYIITEVIQDLVLTELVNISKDRQFSKAKNISYWIKGKNTDQRKWSRPITGLKPTSEPRVYYGDIPKKEKGRFIPKDLLIFRFSKDAHELIIDVYSDFYTEDKQTLHHLIKTDL